VSTYAIQIQNDVQLTEASAHLKCSVQYRSIKAINYKTQATSNHDHDFFTKILWTTLMDLIKLLVIKSIQ